MRLDQVICFYWFVVSVDVRAVPVEPAAASALEAEALRPGARGLTGAPGGPEVPGQSGERVSVDEAAAGGGDGAVLTCYQLKREEDILQRDNWSHNAYQTWIIPLLKIVPGHTP